jgi:hypothetical protein
VKKSWCESLAETVTPSRTHRIASSHFATIAVPAARPRLHDRQAPDLELPAMFGGPK